MYVFDRLVTGTALRPVCDMLTGTTPAASAPVAAAAVSAKARATFMMRERLDVPTLSAYDRVLSMRERCTILRVATWKPGRATQSSNTQKRKGKNGNPSDRQV